MNRLSGIRRHRRRRRTALPRVPDAESLRQRMNTLGERGLAYVDAARAELESQIQAHAENFAVSDGETCPITAAPWSSQRWHDWSPSVPEVPSRLRIGEFVSVLDRSAFRAPAIIDITGQGAPLVVLGGQLPSETAMDEFLAATLYRLAVTLGPGAEFRAMAESDAPVAALVDLPMFTGEIGTIEAELARTMSLVQQFTRQTERGHPAPAEAIQQRVLVAGGFPHGYGDRAIEALSTIAQLGPRLGIYLVVHATERSGLLDRLGRPIIVDCSGSVADFAGLTGSIVLDSLPALGIQRRLAAALTTNRLVDPPMRWTPDHDDAVPEWRALTEGIVRASIGRTPAGDDLFIEFGSESISPDIAAHAYVAAVHDSDRQHLLENLISDIALHHGPSAVRMRVIGCACHQTPAWLKDIPHLELHATSATSSTLESLLRELIAEAEEQRGGRIALRDSAGQGDTWSGPQRIVVIDNFEHLLADDTTGELADLLVLALERCAEVGTHLVLGGRGSTYPTIVRRSDILDLVRIRIVFALADDEVAVLTELGVAGRRLVATHCDRPGRFVCSKASGAEGTATASRLTTIADEQRIAIRALLQERAACIGTKPSAVILSGVELPRLAESPLVKRLIERDHWPTIEQFSAAARRSRHLAGTSLGAPGDRPIAVLVGQAHRVEDQAMAILSRRDADNMVMVSADPHARAGMIASAFIGLALTIEACEFRLIVCDRSPASSPWFTTLEHATIVLADLGVDVVAATTADDADAAIVKAADLVRSRRALSEDELRSEPSVVIVLNEPDRVPLLVRQRSHGVPVGPMNGDLQELLFGGPELGIHTIVAGPTLNTIHTAVEPTTLERSIRFRVSTHVPDVDSYRLTRSSAAARLGVAATGSEAVLYDSVTQRRLTFRPFSSWVQDDHVGGPHLDDDVQAVGARLKQRVIQQRVD